MTLGDEPAAGKRVLLASPQQVAAGTSHVTFQRANTSLQVSEITTDETGVANMEVVIADVWQVPAASAFSSVILQAQLADDPAIKGEITAASIEDNLAEVARRYRTIPSGLVLDPAIQEFIRTRLDDRHRARFETAWAGVQNDALASDLFAYSTPARSGTSSSSNSPHPTANTVRCPCSTGCSGGRR